MDIYVQFFLMIISLIQANAYSSWMVIGNIAFSTPLGRHTCEQLPLVKQQKLYCRRDPTVIESIRDGTRLSIRECQHQFRNNRWNCSSANQGRGGFGKATKRGSQEAAFIHAITSAGVAYSVTQACSRGRLEHCSCDRRKRGSSRNKSQNFIWGGCSDDVAYGMNFAEEFVDASETNRHDARANMNRHNNRVGRRAMRKFIQRKCKCHGPTATCSIRTCWDELKSFRYTGRYLKSLYDAAVQVTVKQDGSIVKLLSEDSNPETPGREQLVFLEPSPNYCKFDPHSGSLGTSGRECNKTSSGEFGCARMCCGRGYNSGRIIRSEKCKCKFHWCCEVICQTCIREVDVFTCKPEGTAGNQTGSSTHPPSLHQSDSISNQKHLNSRKTRRKCKLQKTNNLSRKKKRKKCKRKKRKKRPKKKGKTPPNKIIRTKRNSFLENSLFTSNDAITRTEIQKKTQRTMKSHRKGFYKNLLKSINKKSKKTPNVLGDIWNSVWNFIKRV